MPNATTDDGSNDFLMNAYASVQRLEEKLELPKDFYWNLYKQEDEWSLIVKLNALFETTVNQLLGLHLEEPFEGFVSKLPYSSNQKHSRISLLRVYEPDFRKGSIDCISEVARIRNRLAHSISNVKFNLIDYVANLTPDALNAFKSKFTQTLGENPTSPDGDVMNRGDYAEHHPREIVWVTGLFVLFELHTRIEFRERLKTSQLEYDELVEETLAQHKEITAVLRWLFARTETDAPCTSTTP